MKLTVDIQYGIISAMIDRIKEKLLGKPIHETPQDSQDAVLMSYKILRWELDRAEQARISNDPKVDQEHASRVRGRMGNLKDIVIATALAHRTIFAYPQYIPIKGEGSRFYLPVVNKVVSAESQDVQSGISPIITVPNLNTAKDIGEEVWCADREMVENIANSLVYLLPSQNYLHIMSAVSEHAA